jgi:hypothetical protein
VGAVQDYFFGARRVIEGAGTGGTTAKGENHAEMNLAHNRVHVWKPKDGKRLGQMLQGSLRPRSVLARDEIGELDDIVKVFPGRNGGLYLWCAEDWHAAVNLDQGVVDKVVGSAVCKDNAVKNVFWRHLSFPGAALAGGGRILNVGD